ncbi:pickpocket protein 19-like, partial [Musca domestica]|uniref:Pickpocket protein 19-like n=1 Tax=Musca domestica TaxID=7370 RepID=A0ABM3UQP5_MUSDO
MAIMAYPDFRPAQPEAIRRLNQKYSHRDSQNRSCASRKEYLLKLKDDLLELLAAFSEKTTVHGMGRLFNRNANKYERLFWLLTLSLAVFGTTYVCIFLSDRFNAGNLQSIVDDTGAPVYKIPFPTITICNVNRLNWQRIDEAKERFLPGVTDNETLNLFELVIGRYDRIEFAYFDLFAPLENQTLQLVANVNFSLVYEFMAWNCDELLEDCVWRHREMNCCDIFLKRRSKSGICWSFNSLETEEGRERQKNDAKYPWRTGSAGPQSALTVKVLINRENHYSSEVEKGILVMVSEPKVWHREPFFIPENTDTTVGIDPTIYFYDENTRSLTSAQRQCVFHDEHHLHDFKVLEGFDYMIENCHAECHRGYLEKYCNCTMDILFPPGQYKPCRVTDLVCLARNNDYFRYTHQEGADEYVRQTHTGMKCKCFNNCYSLQYMTYVRPTFLPPDVRGNKSYVDLDIHFRSETMMVYCTNLVFSWIDLMVAFGGIAGLFMGCSLISAVEVFYFLFIQIPTFAYREYQARQELRRNEAQQQFNQNIMQSSNNNGSSNNNITNIYRRPSDYYEADRKLFAKNRISIVENMNKNYINSHY